MRQQLLVMGLSLSLLASSGLGQTNQSERLLYPFLTLESQTNLEVTANWERPRNCPLELTNLFSNTNLFSRTEQQSVKEAVLKYKDVSTNSGPAGSMFTGMEKRQWSLGQFTDKFSVAHFIYTNSGATDEIRFSERMIMARFRTRLGAGYDVKLIDGRLAQYQQYAGGVLDGLYVDGTFDSEHCNGLARCVNGKMVGKLICWAKDGQICLEMKFKEPFDFMKYQTIKHDMAWTEVTTNTTNSTIDWPVAPAGTNSLRPASAADKSR